MSIAPHDMTDKKGYLVNIEVPVRVLVQRTSLQETIKSTTTEITYEGPLYII
jgi:hypothetical protein